MTKKESFGNPSRLQTRVDLIRCSTSEIAIMHRSAKQGRNSTRALKMTKKESFGNPHRFIDCACRVGDWLIDELISSFLFGYF